MIELDEKCTNVIKIVIVLYVYYHYIFVTVFLSLKELLYEANMKQLRCANPQKSERTKVWAFLYAWVSK